jgi:hypothetical protein
VPTRAREGREMTRAPKALVPLTTDLPNVASGRGDPQPAPPPPLQEECGPQGSPRPTRTEVLGVLDSVRDLSHYKLWLLSTSLSPSLSQIVSLHIRSFHRLTTWVIAECQALRMFATASSDTSGLWQRLTQTSVSISLGRVYLSWLYHTRSSRRVTQQETHQVTHDMF